MNTPAFDASDGVALFTDGSAHWKDRSGGWAWLALDSGVGMFKSSGAQSGVTINQMELTAVINGLEQIERQCGSCEVIVYSDSEYVVLGASQPTRARNKNKRLWTALDKAIKLHRYVEFCHVKGHSGDIWNEMVDQAAGEARREALEADQNDDPLPDDAASARERVRIALGSQQWTPGYELTQPAVGGSEGLRRLRELRAEGLRIRARRMEGSNAYEYQWVEG